MSPSANVLIFVSVLPAFRRRGVAARLLRSLMRQCEQWSNVEVSFPEFNFSDYRKYFQKIFLHCQTSNEAALCLYRAHGFVAVQQIRVHYRRNGSIDGDESADAFLLERRIND